LKNHGLQAWRRGSQSVDLENFNMVKFKMAIQDRAEVESNLANAPGVLFNLACSISRLLIAPPVFPASACTAGTA
jgi:hypothetical protein